MRHFLALEQDTGARYQSGRLVELYQAVFGYFHFGTLHPVGCRSYVANGAAD
jgi:hypothetical protein